MKLCIGIGLTSTLVYGERRYVSEAPKGRAAYTEEAQGRLACQRQIIKANLGPGHLAKKIGFCPNTLKKYVFAQTH